MNARERQKIIKNVLLPCLPNFRRSFDSTLVMWPVEHLWRGFSLGYSRESRGCYFAVSVMPLYVKTSKDPGCALTIGKRLMGGHLFLFTPEAYEESAAQLRKAVLEEGVPYLNKFSRPEAILGIVDPFNQSGIVELKAYTNIYLKNYEKAIPELEFLINTRNNMPRHHIDNQSEWCKAGHARNQTMLEWLRSEPEKAHQLVLELKAETIVNFQLNEIRA